MAIRTLFAVPAFALLLSLATAGAAPSGAAQRPVKAKCNPAKQTVTWTDRGRRVRRHPGTLAENERASIVSPIRGHRMYFACWKPTRRASFLTEYPVSVTVPPSLNGRYAGLTLARHGNKPYRQFRSVNVQTGRVLHDSGRLPPARGLGDSLVVVTRRGAIAWLHDSVLHATDKSGTRTLATADRGRIYALAVSSSTVYWTQGGAPHSATLR